MPWRVHHGVVKGIVRVLLPRFVRGLEADSIV